MMAVSEAGFLAMEVPGPTLGSQIFEIDEYFLWCRTIGPTQINLGNDTTEGLYDNLRKGQNRKGGIGNPGQIEVIDQAHPLAEAIRVYRRIHSGKQGKIVCEQSYRSKEFAG